MKTEPSVFCYVVVEVYEETGIYSDSLCYKRGLVIACFVNARSILENGNVVWAGAARPHLDRLERSNINL